MHAPTRTCGLGLWPKATRDNFIHCPLHETSTKQLSRYPVRFGEGLCNQGAQDLFRLAHLRFMFAMLAESWGKSRRVRDHKGHNTVKT